MKKIIACITLVFVFAFGIYALTCIEKVEAGSVGVKVNLLGSSKGVEVEILASSAARRRGRVSISPLRPT